MVLAQSRFVGVCVLGVLGFFLKNIELHKHVRISIYYVCIQINASKLQVPVFVLKLSSMQVPNYNYLSSCTYCESHFNNTEPPQK